MKISNSNGKDKIKTWKANLNEDPGLEKDLQYLMMKTKSKTHAELLSRMSFAHRNIETIDSIWKLMLKPDNECSKSEMLAKRFFKKLYHLTGVSSRELSELIIDEINKVQDQNYNESKGTDKNNSNNTESIKLYRKHININHRGGN